MIEINLKFVKKYIMSILEKRDYIYSRLHGADENLINEFYEKLLKEETLKAKLINRARKSENDIHNGKVYTREKIEQKTNNIGS